MDQPGRVLLARVQARAAVDQRGSVLGNEHAHVVVDRGRVRRAVGPRARIELEDPDLVDRELLGVLVVPGHVGQDLAAEDDELVPVRVVAEGRLAHGVGALTVRLDLLPGGGGEMEGPQVEQVARVGALAAAEDQQPVPALVVDAIVLAARVRLAAVRRERGPARVGRRVAPQVQHPDVLLELALVVLPAHPALHDHALAAGIVDGDVALERRRGGARGVAPAAPLEVEGPRLAAGVAVLAAEQHELVVGAVEDQSVVLARRRLGPLGGDALPAARGEVEGPQLVPVDVVVALAAVQPQAMARAVVGERPVLAESRPAPPAGAISSQPARGPARGTPEVVVAGEPGTGLVPPAAVTGPGASASASGPSKRSPTCTTDPAWTLGKSGGNAGGFLVEYLSLPSPSMSTTSSPAGTPSTVTAWTDFLGAFSTLTWNSRVTTSPRRSTLKPTLPARPSRPAIGASRSASFTRSSRKSSISSPTRNTEPAFGSRKPDGKIASSSSEISSSSEPLRLALTLPSEKPSSDSACATLGGAFSTSSSSWR